MFWKVLFYLLLGALLLAAIHLLVQYAFFWLVALLLVLLFGYFLIRKAKQWVLGKKQSLDLWVAAKKKWLGSITN